MSAKLIVLANTKGGVGKSTLAGNLAWAFASKGHDVAVVDADPQASITKWCDLADEVPFDRFQLTTARVLHHQLPRLRKHHDLVIVDCPPIQGDVTTASLVQADLGLIPIQPSPFDVLAYSELVPLVQQARGINSKLRIFFVINQLSRRTVLAREIEESLTDTDVPLLRTRVHSRQIYRRVVASGGSVIHERGPARREILSLSEDVIHALEG